MEKLLGVKDVAARFGMSIRGVWRYVQRGELPEPVKMGNLSRWVDSELDAVFEKLKQRRRGPQPH